MPLPDNGATWPPPQLGPILPKIAEWKAWWVGTPEALTAAYGAQHGGVTRIDRPAQYRGGLTGAVARFWWGQPIGDLTSGSARDRTHIPVARSIARASSKALYAEPPQFAFPEPPDGAQVDPYETTAMQVAQYVEDGLHSDLASGAEVGAALGGRYHRVTWDGTVAPRPFLTTIHPDNAVPEFSYDRLRAVTFWWVLPTKDTGVVMRHLERHELDSAGNGVVYHGLYQGSADSLGRVVPLADHHATAGLADHVDDQGAVRVGRTPGLCVEYIPNKPGALWASDPLGKSLGVPDIDGVEGLMDNLDEAWSAWMRDVRQSKGRLIVPDAYLDDLGPGYGTAFDMDREVFTGVTGVLPKGTDGNMLIEKVQFTVPVEQHQVTIQEAEEKILLHAGYSAATFGEASSDGVTATEIRDRRTLTNETKNAKARIEKAAVARLVLKMLSIDVDVFATRGLLVDVAPVVDFDDGIHESPQERAEQALSAFQSQSASAAERVRMHHPEWDEARVDVEVAAIRDEFSLGAMSDPADPGLFGN